MTVTQERPAVPAPAAPRTPSGTVLVRVQGIPVLVPEPTWCVADHSTNYIALDDVSHFSESIALSAPLYAGGTTELLSAAIYQWPYESDGGAPYLGLDSEGGSDVAPLGFVAALAFADQLVAHADRIRAMVKTIGSAQ